MAGKQHNYSTDSTGTAFLAQHPPRISLNSPLLASAIDLPPQPRISYSVYTVATDPAAPTVADQLDKIEQARRRIWQENKSRPIPDALFPGVRIARDSLALYVFTLGSGETPLNAEASLQALRLDGLNRAESSYFAVAGLYPCSASCSGRVTPCPACIQPANDTLSGIHASTSQPSSTCLLPRTSLRRLFAQFLQALRDRLIDDITSVEQAKSDHGTSGRSAVRLNDGFLMRPLSTSSPSEWGTGWDHRPLQRTLVHCQLQIQLTSSRVLIHPILRPTCYSPLSSVLPLPIGTPITLLPHGVTAYYLNAYTGPVGGLTAQFDTALSGFGAGHWKGSNTPNTVDPGLRSSLSYAIVWLAVQNKQGEDKGIRAIWPTSLCVAFGSSTLHSPPPLPYIPDLPAQLQSSPPAIPHIPAAVNVKSSFRALTPSASASSIPSPATDTHPTHILQSRQGTPKPSEVRPDTLTATPRRRRIFPGPHSPTSNTLCAFKTLTLVKRDIHQIAGEISGYVDVVVKEREKERERLKREREGNSSRNLSSPSKVAEKPRVPEPRKPSLLPAINTPVTPVNVALRIAANAAKASILNEPTVHIANDSIAAAPVTPSSIGLLPAPEIIPSTTHQQLSMDVSPNDDISKAAGPSIPAPVTADTGMVFEGLDSFDHGWVQGSGEFMNMNLDINMDAFDYPMSDDGGTFGVDGTFGPFTDDDFSIFDAPVVRPSAIVSSSVAPLSVVAPTTIDSNMHATGPGPPTAIAQGLPWMSQGATDSFTPRSMDTPGSIPPPPELMPSTPTLTPPSQSLPVTPTVMLADQSRPVHGQKGMAGGSSLLFDPIPFAEAHKLSDGKYNIGKFALPTPPDEEDRTQPIPIRHPFPRRAGTDWKISYEAATDPRVGIIRRLKRKRCHKEEAGRIASPAWISEREEWMSPSYGESPDSDNDDALSASEDEDEADDDEVEDQDVEVVPRAYTPPPPYLPVGPALIATHFSHTYLLPMSSPLRPPGANTGGIVGLMSVPTPVSPAAILGDSSTKSKSLEESVQILVKELIENSVWEHSWRASSLMSYAARITSEVWQVDVQHVHQLLDSLELSLRTPMNLWGGFSDEMAGLSASMQELDEPLLAVGKSNTIIQVLPSALRFWDKLGLTPRAGKKDLNAFVLYDGGEEKEQQLASWLDRVSAAYDAKGFGRHFAGHAPSCVRDGLVPIHFETIRKTLVSFIASLPEQESPAVFYIILPANAMNLNSHTLRRVLQGIRKAAKGVHNVSRVFQLVPEAFVSGALDIPHMNHSGLELMAASLYDRLRIPSRRFMARPTVPQGDNKVWALFQEPAYILARPMRRRAKFLREAHPTTLDVLDRHMLLEVAYSTSPCGKWLFVVVVDQTGAAHDLCAHAVPGDSPESFVVSTVWEFALGMAMKANVEWHVVIAKWGFMSPCELDAWYLRLDPETLTCGILPPLRVTLLVAETDTQWHFLSPDSVQSTRTPLSPSRVPKLAPGTVFSDVSATTYLLHPGTRTTLSPPPPSYLYSAPACILDPEDEKGRDELGMRPLATTTLVRVPAGSDHAAISMLHLHVLGSVQSPHSTAIAGEDVLRDVATNFYDLSVLTRERWKLSANPILPFHLAALEVMQLALDKGDAIVVDA